MAQTLNLSAYRGDTFKGGFYTITLSGGNPLDLTGAEIISQLKKCPDDDSIFDFTVTITEPLSGQFQIDPVIIDIPGDKVYLQDIQITTNDGIVRTPVRGTLFLINDISR